ncbi:FUSC family protein [Gryllotalpicola reticulitermitis]|uniref:FUSC family protein n=1 Tax=Gryllotalpicola reticulitermitis TaxID=1184153 RepID=A0ABV8Q3S8_9MICO
MNSSPFGARVRDGARFAVASVVAALLSFWTIAYFARHDALVVQLCISGVIIALSIVRSDERRSAAGAGGGERMPAWALWLARLAMVPLVALLGTVLGRLVPDDPELGFALIGVPLVLAIWVRRFGPVWTRLGSLWSFPFIASLVTPAAAITRGAGVWWGALAALIAVAWGSVLGWLVSASAAAAPTGERAALATRGRPAAGSRRLAASDRMAIHLAISLAAAILLGWWLLPAHLGWLVLTAFIVNSGNRGRADVVYKGVQRLVGAGVGTILATAVGTLFDPGDSGALVAMFVVLGIGALLRPASYAWWAAAMTGALALLYGYLGEGGVSFLGERLLAILIGGAVAIAASYFVVPVRSIDVVRRRTADLLGLGREILTADRSDPAYPELRARVPDASARVRQLAPPFHALRFVTSGRSPAARRTADLIDRATALGESLEGFALTPSRELGAELGAELGSVRELLLAFRGAGRVEKSRSDAQ